MSPLEWFILFSLSVGLGGMAAVEWWWRRPVRTQTVRIRTPRMWWWGAPRHDAKTAKRGRETRREFHGGVR